MVNWLVVEPYPSEKYGFVKWEGRIIPYIVEKRFQTTNQMICSMFSWRHKGCGQKLVTYIHR